MRDGNLDQHGTRRGAFYQDVVLSELLREHIVKDVRQLLKVLLLFAIPFVLILIYGYFS